ncbi:hypothetical protein [Streptomyces sp. AMCC400023]|uniref:hypothetical protein n=1 Tax=Streptomyces sp. AMCC400023 TaxID=2056258 RepID=UPI001F42CEB3|nr:hypothetical protein [Streptomyces sp. AMCC400023]UJV42960.1 hypothetical protein CVT30_26735 [Streptomyces sp. AMCC400023]
MGRTRIKVTRQSDGKEVNVGDELMVDHNLPVTLVRVVSPLTGDDETGDVWPGRVEVRYSWGAVEEVDDVRAGVAVDEV